MRTTIDAAGRLVIPKAVCDAAGLKPGMELDVRVCEGRIEIEPSASFITLVQRGRWLVAVLSVDAEPLPGSAVQDLIEQLREERMDQILGP